MLKLCMTDVFVQIYVVLGSQGYANLITGWLGLDIAVLNPVLSWNGFTQRFSKPPLEVCTDPWT